MSQRDLAHQVGVSLGALNYCLKALMDKGFVKIDNFQNSKHKFKYVYVLTPEGVAQRLVLAGRFLRRKLDEYERLKAEIDDARLDLGEDVGRPKH